MTQLTWFATRGAGIVSLLLLTVVMCLGILTVLRWQSDRWPRFLTTELHRTLSLLALAFLAFHVVTAVIDPYTNLGVIAAILPWASTYRPLWTGLGVLSMDVALALVATSLVRTRIPLRLWRAVHWTAYAAWPLAVLHTLGAGTDAFTPWMLAIVGLCVAAVIAAVAWRVYAAAPNRDALPAVAAGPGRTGAAPPP